MILLEHALHVIGVKERISWPEQEAEADHVFGVPFFIFRGEPFWGYDRLGLLEERLTEAGLALGAAASAA